jgi:hypothetical protein
MEHLHNKAEHIEEVINSLNNITKAEAPPFFYTRLRARLHQDVDLTLLQRIIGFIVRPAFAIVTLSFFILFNTVAISSVLLENIGITESNTSNNSSLQSFVKEYDLSVSTLYSDIKTNE